MGTSLDPVGEKARRNFSDLEQEAFEKWLEMESPSGDAESVQDQWLRSMEYAELLDEYEADGQADAQAGRDTHTVTPPG